MAPGLARANVRRSLCRCGSLSEDEWVLYAMPAPGQLREGPSSTRTSLRWEIGVGDRWRERGLIVLMIAWLLPWIPK
jgi:hypothetical protein